MHTHSLAAGGDPSGVVSSAVVRSPVLPSSAAAAVGESGDGGEGDRRLISGSRQDFGRELQEQEGRNEGRALAPVCIMIK